jgi:hypothetical protein
MTRFERRVRQLEARAGGGRATIPAEWEIWIELKDGAMRGKHGEIISRKAFEQRRPFARTIVILPDNGRDDLDAIRGRPSALPGCHVVAAAIGNPGPGRITI